MTKIATIRGMTVAEWRDLIVEEIDRHIDRKSRSCLNCIHFEDDTQLCRLAGKIPPPKIAVTGCERWEEEIPF